MKLNSDLIKFDYTDSSYPSPTYLCPFNFIGYDLDEDLNKVALKLEIAIGEFIIRESLKYKSYSLSKCSILHFEINGIEMIFLDNINHMERKLGFFNRKDVIKAFNYFKNQI